jgi:hypothetical protein
MVAKKKCRLQAVLLESWTVDQMAAMWCDIPRPSSQIKITWVSSSAKQLDRALPPYDHTPWFALSKPPARHVVELQGNQPLTAVPPKSSRKICAPSVSHGARCTDCGLVSARPAAVLSSFPSLHEDIDCSHGIWTAFCPAIPWPEHLTSADKHIGFQASPMDTRTYTLGHDSTCRLVHVEGIKVFPRIVRRLFQGSVQMHEQWLVYFLSCLCMCFPSGNSWLSAVGLTADW